jgi:hypothetical protein
VDPHVAALHVFICYQTAPTERMKASFFVAAGHTLNPWMGRIFSSHIGLPATFRRYVEDAEIRSTDARWFDDAAISAKLATNTQDLSQQIPKVPCLHKRHLF